MGHLESRRGGQGSGTGPCQENPGTAGQPPEIAPSYPFQNKIPAAVEAARGLLLQAVNTGGFQGQPRMLQTAEPLCVCVSFATGCARPFF